MRTMLSRIRLDTRDYKHMKEVFTEVINPVRSRAVFPKIMQFDSYLPLETSPLNISQKAFEVYDSRGCEVI